jgi:hypothetical protein
MVGLVLAQLYFPAIVDPIHAIWGAVGGFWGASDLSGLGHHAIEMFLICS